MLPAENLHLKSLKVGVEMAVKMEGLNKVEISVVCR